MNSTTGAVRRTQSLVALLVATALALVGLALAPAPTAHAAGGSSPVPIFFERGSANFGTDPSTQITDTGWWAHEGPSRGALETAVATDLTDGSGAITDASQAAWLASLGVDDYSGLDGFGHLGIAFVPTSADGSAEMPVASAGQSALDVFDWVTDLQFPASFSPSRDDVYTISTKAEFDAWVADGKPEQQADASLVYHDIFRAGSPVSTAPKGKSLLNRWAAGQDISLVVFQFDTTDANGVPVIGPQSIEGGHVVSAWTKFTTVAHPARAVATSAGYRVVNDVATPTVTLTDSWATGATTGTLTAKLTGSGGTTLTDATGTVQFSALPKGASSGTYTAYGAPVAVSANGTASVAVTGLNPGEIQKFQATYTPDAAASGTYTSATGGPKTVIRPSVEPVTPTIATKLKPSRVHVGNTPKLTVTVNATGVTPTGKVKVRVDPPKGKTKTFSAKLSGGKATLALIKAKSTGTVKVKVTYLGSELVAKATKSLSYRVRR